ncbi:hypothetical protein LTR36_003363 [Oleoguttula mirabilis]|uniref:Non-reducing end beta-L-arabinofuranosidase n=1 Tax=Oleoguttula mirabilis TaxID=1507867 RepID=A0AAV9JXK6_9PEZI|nr:hypothetical protein LTR36_003363 [Oleoguttula mirabilis]
MENPQSSYTHTAFPSASFWGRRRDVVRTVTLPFQLDMLKKTGRYDAFKLKWHPSYSDPPNVWPVPNHLFWDSDVAKWIEGACYFLREHEEPDIRAAIHELVEMIRGAQQEDGYLNIHFTVVEPGKRFSNLRDKHELYNAGHLIEAALAHHACFRTDGLLEPILKYVDLLIRTFGSGSEQKHGYPGHPEIELALLRLYRVTQDERHLQLAEYFLSERGNPKGVDGQHFYAAEKEARGEREGEWPVYYPRDDAPYRYSQAHLPITEQPTVEGHAVRAMYLLTAVADLCALVPTGEAKTTYVDSLHRLWSNMVGKKMYLTGGIGAIARWEGFGINYFLPQSTDEGGCYAETCAAIGVVLLAERLLQIELDAKFADVMELCLYNAVLTGMSHDGKAFTYTNQLASSDLELSERKDWFQCACCPPNVSRLFGYLGGFVWTHKTVEPNQVELDIHLYTAASITVPVGDSKVTVRQETDWPSSGKVTFSVEMPSEVEVALRLRIPGWATEWTLEPELADPVVEHGYLTVPPPWVRSHPRFSLEIPMAARLVAPHPYTNQAVAAVARGPIVYCVEDADNTWVTDHFKSVIFDTSVSLQEVKRTDIFADETIIGVCAVDAASFLHVPESSDAWYGTPSDSLQANKKESLNFIPYYARANRGGKGMMRVGIRVQLG